MAHKRRYGNKQPKKNRGSAPAPPPPRISEMPKRAPVVYGKAFVLLEDENKNTFVYKNGQWVPHETSVAVYRQECEVDELPQKVNRRTRYEVRCPVHIEP